MHVLPSEDTDPEKLKFTFEVEKINEDIAGLDDKIGNYERIMAVMELKRALVTVQEMSMGNSSKVKAKSDEVVAGIESLLMELDAGTGAEKISAGTVSIFKPSEKGIEIFCPFASGLLSIMVLIVGNAF